MHDASMSPLFVLNRNGTFDGRSERCEFVRLAFFASRKHDVIVESTKSEFYPPTVVRRKEGSDRVAAKRRPLIAVKAYSCDHLRVVSHHALLDSFGRRIWCRPRDGEAVLKYLCDRELVPVERELDSGPPFNTPVELLASAFSDRLRTHATLPGRTPSAKLTGNKRSRKGAGFTEPRSQNPVNPRFGCIVAINLAGLIRDPRECCRNGLPRRVACVTRPPSRP